MALVKFAPVWMAAQSGHLEREQFIPFFIGQSLALLLQIGGKVLAV